MFISPTQAITKAVKNNPKYRHIKNKTEQTTIDEIEATRVAVRIFVCMPTIECSTKPPSKGNNGRMLKQPIIKLIDPNNKTY